MKMQKLKMIGRRFTQIKKDFLFVVFFNLFLKFDLYFSILIFDFYIINYRIKRYVI